jgi:hypothetical protein
LLSLTGSVCFVEFLQLLLCVILRPCALLSHVHD